MLKSGGTSGSGENSSPFVAHPYSEAVWGGLKDTTTDLEHLALTRSDYWADACLMGTDATEGDPAPSHGFSSR
jgi:hypothetical protein